MSFWGWISCEKNPNRMIQQKMTCLYLGSVGHQEIGTVCQWVEEGGHGSGSQLLCLLKLLLDQAEAFLVPKLVN